MISPFSCLSQNIHGVSHKTEGGAFLPVSDRRNSVAATRERVHDSTLWTVNKQGLYGMTARIKPIVFFQRKWVENSSRTQVADGPSMGVYLAWTRVPTNIQRSQLHSNVWLLTNSDYCAVSTKGIFHVHTNVSGLNPGVAVIQSKPCLDLYEESEIDLKKVHETW